MIGGGGGGGGAEDDDEALFEDDSFFEETSFSRFGLFLVRMSRRIGVPDLLSGFPGFEALPADLCFELFGPGLLPDLLVVLEESLACAQLKIEIKVLNILGFTILTEKN